MAAGFSRIVAAGMTLRLTPSGAAPLRTGA
jgi:hypothetical protein